MGEEGRKREGGGGGTGVEFAEIRFGLPEWPTTAEITGYPVFESLTRFQHEISGAAAVHHEDEQS